MTFCAKPSGDKQTNWPTNSLGATMQQVSPANSKKRQSKKVAQKHYFDQGLGAFSMVSVSYS